MRLTRRHVFETHAKYIAPLIGDWKWAANRDGKISCEFFSRFVPHIIWGEHFFYFHDEPMSPREFIIFIFSKWFISISRRTSAEAWYTQQQNDRSLNTLVCIDYKRTH